MERKGEKKRKKKGTGVDIKRETWYKSSEEPSCDLPCDQPGHAEKVRCGAAHGSKLGDGGSGVEEVHGQRDSLANSRLSGIACFKLRRGGAHLKNTPLLLMNRAYHKGSSAGWLILEI
jgi:hypothetical protein